MKKVLNKNKCIIIFISILVISSIICLSIFIKNKNNEPKELTTEEKLEDFRYIYDILEDNYVYFDVNKRLYGYDWLAHKEEFEKYITKKDTDDMYFYITMEDIISKLNDKHTNVLSPASFYYRKELYNKVNSNEYNYTQWVKVLNNPKSEVFYNKIEEKCNEINKTSGNINNKTNYKNFDTNILEQDKIAYIKIKSFRQEYIKNNSSKIYKFFKNIKDYPYLIIDIRGNGGGSTLYWSKHIVPPLIQKSISVKNYCVLKSGEYSLSFYNDKFDDALKPITYLPANYNYPEEVKRDFKYCIESENIIKPENPVGFNGKVYLLVDNRVFSASDAFATFAKTSKWATLIGETTAGDGIGCDPVLVTLPNSGIVIRFSGQMGINPDGTSNLEMGTSPDIRLGIDYWGDDFLDKVVDIIHIHFLE